MSRWVAIWRLPVHRLFTSVVAVCVFIVHGDFTTAGVELEISFVRWDGILGALEHHRDRELGFLELIWWSGYPGGLKHL